jgi:hypothetical protein
MHVAGQISMIFDMRSFNSVWLKPYGKTRTVTLHEGVRFSARSKKRREIRVLGNPVWVIPSQQRGL